MKKIFRYFLLTLLLAFAFCLGGCGTTLTTKMEMSSNFAGSRKMDLEVDLSDLDEERLDRYAPDGDFSNMIEKMKGVMPEHMSVTYEETKKDTYVFHFVLPFTSKEDYMQKVEDILGYEIICDFGCNLTPFAESINMQENFTSKELMKWLPEYLERIGCITSDESKRMFKETSNTLSINGVANPISKEYMYLQKRSYIEIDNINIFTDIDAKEAKLARKIELIFEQNILDQNRDKIEKYLSSVTPKDCMSEWQTMEGKKEKFILLVPPCTPDEMEQVMRTFCASQVNDVQLIIAGEAIGTEDKEKDEEQPEQSTSYSDMWDQAVLGDLQVENSVQTKDYTQPFSYDTVIREQLDLSSFICNSWGEVETAYYISAKNGKPESMIYYPNGEENYGWDYVAEEFPEYYYVENEWHPIYQVVSKVNKAYVPESTDLTTKIKSESDMTREFVFKFDEPFEDIALKHIKTRLDSLFSEHKKNLTYEVNNKKKSATITLKFKGSVKTVDALCELIFGQGYSNISYSCQDNREVSRQYNFSESIDLGKVFDWKYSGNIDYTAKLPGKINKSYTNISGGVNSKADISGRKLNYISTESGYVNANVLGSKTDVATVFFIIIVVLSVLAGIGVIVFVVLRLVKADETEKSVTNVKDES